MQQYTQCKERETATMAVDKDSRKEEKTERNLMLGDQREEQSRKLGWKIN